MRTESEIRSRQGHPAGKAFDVPETAAIEIEPVDSPYRTFLEALEDLESAKLLHGAASLEAEMCAARVRKLREEAITAWRQDQAA